jgi:RND family efflux transporter MFP subunit
MTLRNWVLPVVVACLATATAADEPPPAGLAKVPVALAELPRIYRLDGVAEAVNRTTVSSQTSGEVVEVRFDVDDLVSAGDIIVRIDDREQRAAVSQAQANLEAATARRIDAEQEFERVRGVFERQAVSQADFDKASAARRQARAQEQGAQAALLQARQQLAYTEVDAPYNGIVTERLVEVGETVQPGQPLMTGLSLDDMRVSVDVPQNLVAGIRAERKALAQIGERWVQASEVTVFPVADPRSDTFEVRLRLPEGTDQVFPGMYVKVGFMSGTQNALVIPLGSVVMRSEVVAVYVVDPEGRILFRQVRLGSPAGPDHVVVLSGLAEGELVAADPVAAGIALKAQRRAQIGGT